MDKSILMQRDPIMFFADIPLYESELDDCGASELSVKVPLTVFWVNQSKKEICSANSIQAFYQAALCPCSEYAE